MAAIAVPVNPGGLGTCGAISEGMSSVAHRGGRYAAAVPEMLRTAFSTGKMDDMRVLAIDLPAEYELDTARNRRH